MEQWKDMVGETYLARYGLTYDEVLTHTDCDLTTRRPPYRRTTALERWCPMRFCGRIAL